MQNDNQDDKLPKVEIHRNVHVDRIQFNEEACERAFHARMQKIMDNSLVVPHSRKYRRVAMAWLSDTAPRGPLYKCWHGWLNLTWSLILQLIKK